MNDHVFVDPVDFLKHLESKLTELDTCSEQTKHNLLHACVHVIQYLMESQEMLATRMYELVDVLNAHQDGWEHKLSAFYNILQAGDVTPEQMRDILIEEFCRRNAN